MASDRQVEQALEELYSTDPSEFTKKRDALAKELKKAGHKDAAAAVAARRKPTQIAYVLNQLARQHPDAVAELVDVGRELAREQRRALRGETSHGLRDSIERQRKAISDVGQKAAAVMKSLGVEPMAHLQEVTTALQAALIDPAVGAALEAGQLEKAPEAAVGFGSIPIATESETAAPAPAHRPKTKSSRPPPKPEKDDEEEKAKEKAKEQERARAAHAKAVSEAKAVLAAAEKEAKKAHAEAERARSESEEAEAALKKARAAADEASREARRLASEAAAADRTVAAAEKELAHLEKSAR